MLQGCSQVLVAVVPTPVMAAAVLSSRADACNGSCWSQLCRRPPGCCKDVARFSAAVVLTPVMAIRIISSRRADVRNGCEARLSAAVVPAPGALRHAIFVACWSIVERLAAVRYC
jgi:hypothetical protein